MQCLHLAVVALATAFTSCEKEEFNVNINAYSMRKLLSVRLYLL